MTISGGDGTRLYLRLLGHVRPYWRRFVAGLVAMAVLAATEPALPALLKPMLDDGFIEKDATAIVAIPLLLIALFTVRGVASFASTVVMSWVASQVVMDLRGRMFDRLTLLPARFFSANASGALLSRFTYDVALLAQVSSDVVVSLVKDTLVIVGLLGWMFWLDWRLSLIACLAAPVVVLIVRAVSGRMRRINRTLQEAMGRMNRVLEEAMQGRKAIKIFAGRRHEQRRFFAANYRFRRFFMRERTTYAAYVPFVQLVVVLPLALIIYLALQAPAAEVTAGSFFSFITAMAMLFSPIKRLTGVNANIQRGIAAAETVFRLIDEPPEPDAGAVALTRARGEIEFRGLSFAYDAARAPALRGVDLRIRAGESVALVGPSGSGKTTLVELLPRFYPVEEGAILLDGIDIREIRLADLRRQIAFVSQEALLFDDTVAANIAYGELADAAPAEIERAARAANALEFIERMPLGMETPVGERGVLLSGGQRQRLAIARAFLKNAPILILDEATSALDGDSERHIQSALETLKAGRTTLIVAHRLSTIEGADRIFVLQGGRIVESGRHAALIAQRGLYARLYRGGFAGDGKAPVAAA